MKRPPPALERVARRWEGRLARAVGQVLAARAASIDLDALERALAAGDRAKAERIALASIQDQDDLVDDDGDPLFERLLDVMHDAANATRDQVTPTGDAVASARLAFQPVPREAQTRIEAAVGEVASAVNGTLVDGEPVDVTTTIDRQTHGIDVRLFGTVSSGNIAVTRGTQARLKRWAESHKAIVHTVAVDDRMQLQPSAYAGARIRYQRGTGTMRLSKMITVRDANDLRELLAMTSSQLAARERRR